MFAISAPQMMKIIKLIQHYATESERNNGRKSSLSRIAKVSRAECVWRAIPLRDPRRVGNGRHTPCMRHALVDPRWTNRIRPADARISLLPRKRFAE